jgi:hypothetical protein
MQILQTKRRRKMSEEKSEVEVIIENDILDAFKRQKVEKIVSETTRMVTLMLMAKITLDIMEKLAKALKGGEL